jgi:hypothetical protein
LAKKEYDRFGAHLHYSIYKALSIEMTAKWNTDRHTHTERERERERERGEKAKRAAEYEDVTALWNQGVSTDREVTKNRPDLIIKKQGEKVCSLIDVAVPADKCHVKGSRK